MSHYSAQLDNNGICTAVTETIEPLTGDRIVPLGGYDVSLLGKQWTGVEWLDAPPLPPGPQWVQFGALLAADPSVNAMVASAAAGAPVLHLMLGVGLGQAAQGDVQTFSQAWSTAIAAGIVSPVLASHVVGLGESCDLPTEFLQQLNPQ
jgi:hypothetical protein